MSLSLERANLKTSLKALSDNTDDTIDPDVAIDSFIAALEAFISAGKLTIPIGGIVVTGSAATQNNPAEVIVDNSLS